MFVIFLCRNVSEGKQLAGVELRKSAQKTEQFRIFQPYDILTSLVRFIKIFYSLKTLSIKIMSQQFGVKRIGDATRSLALQPVKPLRTIQHVRYASHKTEAKSKPTTEVGFSQVVISYRFSHSVVSRAVSPPPVTEGRRSQSTRKPWQSSMKNSA